MQKILINHCLEIKSSSIHGYGVFAKKTFQPDDIIEECYTLFFSESFDEFRNYTFHYDEKETGLPLGFGCIYNHSEKPNAHFKVDRDNNLIVFTAIAVINPGEEICSSYGKKWFENRDIKIRDPLATLSTKQIWHRWYRKYQEHCHYFLGMGSRASLILVGLYATIRIL